MTRLPASSALLTLLILSTGCSSLTPSKTLASRQYRSASDLSSVRLAQREKTPQSIEASRRSLRDFINLNFTQGTLKQHDFIGSDGIQYHVHLASAPTDWKPQNFDRFAFPPNHSTKSTTLQWSGWGVPAVGVSLPSREQEPFAPRQGYRLPVTIVATTQLRHALYDTEIRFLNPETTQTISFEGRKVPIAGNLEAANRATFQTRNPLLIGLRWLFSVDRFSYPTRLVFIQPYDKSRIPVVLVHGLLSTQAMWGEVIRSLQSDPTIRRNYQFWCFHYPTGQPIPISALQLRQDLRTAEKRYQPRRGIVLIGHSMGGILSRAQVSDSGGTALVEHIFRDNTSRVLKRLPEAPLLRDALIFNKDQNVKRVIFICVPHRGSTLATAGPVGFVTALIRLPNDIVSTFSEVSDIFTSLNLNRPPTGICGLSPHSRFLQALNQRPISVPHHTILGDRGRGDSPKSSDGVVSYSSAHLATTESELIVPCGHGAFRHPAALAEMKRILHEYLEQ